MRQIRRVCRALPVLILIPLLFAGAREVYCAWLIDYILPFMSRLSGAIAYPVSALVVALIVGAMLARPRRAPRVAVALAYILAAIWLPLYSVKPYELPKRNMDADALYTLCARLGARANESQIYRAWREDSLARAGAAVDSLKLSRGEFAPPKRSRYSEWMRAARVAGVYLPITGEALISEYEPDALKPFIACHEAAHARGLADEGQANIAAYIACAHMGGEFEYSACVTALKYALNELRALSEARAAQIYAELSGGVYADVKRVGGARGFGAFGDYNDITLYLLAHPDIV